MTEIKIEDGKICTNGLGLPVELTGAQALLQLAYNRLNITRGAFPYDRNMGCRIQYAVDVTDKTAVQFAQEALFPYPEIEVVDAKCDAQTVTVWLKTPFSEGCVRVKRKEEEHDA